MDRNGPCNNPRLGAFVSSREGGPQPEPSSRDWRGWDFADIVHVAPQGGGRLGEVIAEVTKREQG